MDRKLFGFLSSWQLTALASVAIIAPSVGYAVATNPVSITDPGTGAQSYVDAGRKVWVYDSIAGYANNPQNFVRISGSCSNSHSTFIYVPPTGKALVIRGANFTGYGGTAGLDNFVYLRTSSGDIAGFESKNVTDHEVANLGTGYYVNGDNMKLYCSSFGTFNASVEGFLVPSALIPPQTLGHPVAAPRSAKR